MAACPGSEKSPDCDSEMPITSGLPLPLEPPLLLLDPPPHAAAITAITTTVTVTLNLLRRVFTTTPLLAIGCTLLGIRRSPGRGFGRPARRRPGRCRGRARDLRRRPRARSAPRSRH